MKTAIVTGTNGQDGPYLAKLLVENGYNVVAADRRRSRGTSGLNYFGLSDKVTCEYVDLLDSGSIQRLIRKYKPDEFYNLAAQSFVGVSFDQPLLTSKVNAEGVLHILEAIRVFSPETRLYQASTSEMFGDVLETPQSELTPFNPRSPYGVAKVFAHQMIRNYREAFGLFCSSGILFNHESPLRGEEFVTRKITKSVAAISMGLQEKMYLGNLDAKRDWGYAGDYVVAMWKMLQADSPGDYVIATGKTFTVREFATRAFSAIGIELTWRGSGVDEKGLDSSSENVLVEVDPTYFRPTEVDLLIGDPSLAERELGWKSNTDLGELVGMMVNHDLKFDRVC